MGAPDTRGGRDGPRPDTTGSRREAAGDELGEMLAEAARLELDGVAGVLCTVVRATGSTPRDIGARMIVYAGGGSRGTIGGGALEASVSARCRESPPRRPEVVDYDLAGDAGMACGGRVSVMLEPLGASPWLLVFGAGHIASALVPMAVRAGFRVAVVDDLPDRVTAERFPEATMRVGSFATDAWSGLPMDERAYCVIATRGHDHDLEVLRELVERDVAYVGMVASRRKAAAIVAGLRAEGVPADRLARAHAPVGLPIGAETPAEIAVSILAQVIAHRRLAS